MRENAGAGGMPRDPNDVLCGREIDHHFLNQLYQARRTIQNASMRNDVDSIISIISSVPHLRFHDLPRFQVDRVAINFNLRKAFVANNITLHKFKQAIWRNHLLAHKHEHIAQIIQAVIQATTDIAFRFLHDILLPNVSHSNITHHHELIQLITYANHQLQFIHNDFHSTNSQRTRTLFSHDLRLH
jgi:hypothetical protein